MVDTVDDDWLARWVSRKISLANSLSDGLLVGGGYAEAALILCSVLNAIAADLWPGKSQTDKQRFVQLVANYSDPILGTKKISIPLLIGYLRKNGYAGEEKLLRDQVQAAGFSSPRVVTGNDVDIFEGAVVDLCPA